MNLNSLLPMHLSYICSIRSIRFLIYSSLSFVVIYVSLCKLFFFFHGIKNTLSDTQHGSRRNVSPP